LIISVLNRLSFVLVCGELLLFILFVIFAGYFFSSPGVDKVTKSDVIVILGGGTADRLAKGIDLYKRGLGRTLLVTGFPELKSDAVPSYTKWRVDFLKMAGVPEKILTLNGSAGSSLEEAELVKEFLLTNHLNKAIVVSDPPHLRRLSLIYATVFKSEQNISYSLVASEPVWWDASKWWNNTHSAQFVILEAVKFVYFYSRHIIDKV
jgi:uncharacterized SAM-binding protein YcdF (DUF218 family)